MLTSYMRRDPEYREFWQLIHDGFELSQRMVLEVAGYQELLEDNPVSQNSIRLRMRVLPLLVIQQHALMKINILRLERKKKAKTSRHQNRHWLFLKNDSVHIIRQYQCIQKLCLRWKCPISELGSMAAE